MNQILLCVIQENGPNGNKRASKPVLNPADRSNAASLDIHGLAVSARRFFWCNLVCQGSCSVQSAVVIISSILQLTSKVIRPSGLRGGDIMLLCMMTSMAALDYWLGITAASTNMQTGQLGVMT